MSGDSHSTKELILVGTTALALGAAAGVAFSQQATQQKLRRVKRRIASVFASWGLSGVADSISGTSLTNGSFDPAVRTSDLPEGADSEVMSNTRLAVIVRADELKVAGDLVAHAALTVLGQFKKLFKRRDPSLKLWEGGGQRIEVRIASSESVLIAVQEAARSSGISTHTFAGKVGATSGMVAGAAATGKGKERSLMVIGPAEKSKLWNVVGRLELA